MHVISAGRDSHIKETLANTQENPHRREVIHM